MSENQMKNKLIELRERRIILDRIAVQFKKVSYYNAWEIWTKHFLYGDEYIRDISSKDIYLLCAEMQNQRDIYYMSPSEFTCSVWTLCCSRIFDDCARFDYLSDNYEAFISWFDKEVVAWYCEVIQGLI